MLFKIVILVMMMMMIINASIISLDGTCRWYLVWCHRLVLCVCARARASRSSKPLDTRRCWSVASASSLSLHGLERSAAASRGLPLHIWPARRASPTGHTGGRPPARPNMDEGASWIPFESSDIPNGCLERRKKKKACPGGMEEQRVYKRTQVVAACHPR